MDRKIVGIFAVLVISSAFIAPMTYEESDAYVIERLHESMYVAETVIEGECLNLGDTIVTIEGSENHRNMLKYIEDPLHNEITGDDRDLIPSSIGKKMYLYSNYSRITYMDAEYNYKTLEGRQVLEERALSFFVESGQEFKFEIHSIDGFDNSNYVLLIVGGYSDSKYAGDVFEETFNTNTIVYIEPRAYYVDIAYDVSGFSEPNGSSTLFIVACILVAVAILAIMVLAGLHPRWEK